jgi:hypothetical protein
MANETDVFHFGATEKQKRWWKRLIWFILIVAFVLMALNIINDI